MGQYWIVWVVCNIVGQDWIVWVVWDYIGLFGTVLSSVE